MQGLVPHYILERGDSAREYRRRSSTISRTSNSSTSHATTTMTPTQFAASRDIDILPLMSSNVPSENPFGGYARPNDSYGDSGLAHYHMGMITSGSDNRDNGKDESRMLSEATVVDDSSTSSPSDDANRQGKKFGLARPRLVHF
ncbi:hypothetical protein GGI25_000239 [Coemansia spiralis]|uniref:Uncharacterized protein n=2 Tax=Coemansia TaxID=4863 RepID=A0A9W8GF80_9FUNG|nr:hypothetical protein EDC05_000547 [Coemansia umbellata]KAJ2625812.1 hypothetical protein GGI26_000273 [Coemansia sp. RSA 1358]KAJ2680935.1 hypothetical protein GGI25_000239 [Coemansia spiralis]